MSLAIGIERASRRPPGWSAPGPRPAGAAGRPELAPAPGEDLCHLAGDWRILQRLDGHRWSLDDLVTAWFAAAVYDGRSPTHLLDLGCGIGAVLMLLAWRFPAARGRGIEAQAVSVALARRSLAWNGIADRCEVRPGDLRDPALIAPAAHDLVTATPPYLRPGTAHVSRRVQWAGCHFELRGGLEDYCTAAARSLAPGGTFVTCAAAADATRLERAGAAVGMRVTARMAVVPRDGKEALFTVHALRPADAAAGTVEHPPLVVRDRDGRRTLAFVALRRDMGMPP